MANDSYPDVWVIIPALNEEQSIGLVLDDIPGAGRVIVADNGSTDRTAEIAREHGAHVVPEPQRGYGTACLRGLQTVREFIDEGVAPPKVIVFLDADYSDHPTEMPQLVDPILSDEYDFVLGSRLLGQREPGAMPPQSLYGNKLACFLMWLFCGGRFTDLGPFRAIDYEKLCQLNMIDENFGWTIEMQIKAVHAGLRYKEMPAAYRNRIGTSKISGTISGTFKAGGKILYTVARYGLRKPKQQ